MFPKQVTKMRAKAFEFVVLNDGLADIYRVENAADEGDRPKEKLRHKYCLRFRWHVVGLQRFYEAMQAQVRISQAIDVPLLPDINPQDVVVIAARQYRIEQIQEKHDTKPPSAVLALSDIEEAFEFDVQ